MLNLFVYFTLFVAIITFQSCGLTDSSTSEKKNQQGDDNLSGEKPDNTIDVKPPSPPLPDSLDPGAKPELSGLSLTSSSTPSWKWKSAGDGTGLFRFKFNDNDLESGATETRFTSDVTGPPLPDGEHTLYVQEFGKNGVWSETASFNFTIDSVPPEAPLLAGSEVTNFTTVYWTINRGEGGDGSLEYQVNSNSPVSLKIEEMNHEVAMVLTEGLHSIRVREKDAAGNWSAESFFSTRMDLTPPAPVNITCDRGSNPNRPTCTWPRDLPDIAGYFIGFNEAPSPQGEIVSTAAWTPAFDLPAGDHVLTVLAKDQAGNISIPGTAIIDLTPPTAPSVTVSGLISGDPTWSWSSTDPSGAGNFRYKINNADFSSGASVGRATSYNAVGLPDGNHILYVQEADAAGNWSTPATAETTIDRMPPTSPTFTSVGGATNDSQPVWQWNLAQDVTAVRFSFSEDQLEQSAEQSTDRFQPSSPLNNGDQTLFIQSRDAAGNWSSTVSQKFAVDTVKPTSPTITSGLQSTNNETPSWTWSMIQDAVLYRAMIDNPSMTGAIEMTSNVYTAQSVLAEGNHIFYLQAKDEAGNWSDLTIYSFKIDLTPPSAPDVTVLSPTSNTRPTFSWVPSDPEGTLYRFRLNDSDLTDRSQSDSQQFSPNADLAEGTYTFYVQQRDAAGNWSETASAQVEIDTTAKSPPNLTSEKRITNNTRPKWIWTSGGGAGVYRFKLNDDNLSVGSAQISGAGTQSFIPPSALSDGDHTLYVQEQDDLGNWSEISSATTTVDTVAPSTPIAGQLSTPTKIQTPVWLWKSGGGGSGIYRFQLDSSAFSAATPTTTETQFQFSETLSEGQHIVYVQEKDKADNWSSSLALTIFIDITPPNIPKPVVKRPTNNNRPLWSWTEDSDATFYRAAHSLSGLSEASSITSTNYTPGTSLPDGEHTLYVQARDEAGNWSKSSHATTLIDTVSPVQVQISGPEITNNPQPVWSWQSDEQKFRVKLDSNDYELSEKSFQAPSELTEGVHTIYVIAGDEAGNWSIEAKFNTVIDSTPPDAPIFTEIVTPTNNTVPTWKWANQGEAAARYRYSLDVDVNDQTGTETNVLSFTPLSPLSEGPHVLYVQALDKAGNWSVSSSQKVAIDTTGPNQPTLSVNTNNPTNIRMPIWTWRGSGEGNGFFRFRLDNSDMSGEMPTNETSLSTQLAEGIHTLYVQEKDEAGNWSSISSLGLTVDLTPPLPPSPLITSIFSTTRPILSWQSGGGGSGRYILNSSNLQYSGKEVTQPSLMVDRTLTEGSYSIIIREFDAAGNLSSPTSAAFYIDLTPPKPPNVSGPYLTTSERPTWTWVGSEAGSVFRYKLNDDDLTKGSTETTSKSFTPLQSAPLREGDHTLFVQQRDKAGNWSDSGSWKIHRYQICELPVVGQSRIGAEGKQISVISDELLVSLDEGIGTNSLYTIDHKGTTLQTLILSRDDFYPYELGANSTGDVYLVGRADDFATLVIAKYRVNLTSGIIAHDTTFGDNGYVRISDGTRTYYNFKLEILKDGKLQLAGSTTKPENEGLLIRLQSDGSYDSNYGSSGKIFLPSTLFEPARSENQIRDFVAMADGSLRLLINQIYDWPVISVTSDGLIDHQYGANSPWPEANTRLQTISADATGSIHLAGERGNAFKVARLTDAGTLDSTFGIAGIMTIDGSKFSGTVGGNFPSGVTPGRPTLLHRFDGNTFLVSSALINFNNKRPVTIAIDSKGDLFPGLGAYGIMVDEIEASDCSFYPTDAAMTPAGKLFSTGNRQQKNGTECIRYGTFLLSPTICTDSVSFTQSKDASVGHFSSILGSPKTPTAADASGNIYIVSETGFAGRDSKIKKYDSATDTLTEMKEFDDDVNCEAINSAAISSSPNGTVVIVWTCAMKFGEEPEDLYLRMYRPESGWAESIKLDTSYSHFHYPIIASNSKGNFAVAWAIDPTPTGSVSYTYPLKSIFYDPLTGWSPLHQLIPPGSQSLKINDIYFDEENVAQIIVNNFKTSHSLSFEGFTKEEVFYPFTDDDLYLNAYDYKNGNIFAVFSKTSDSHSLYYAHRIAGQWSGLKKFPAENNKRSYSQKAVIDSKGGYHVFWVAEYYNGVQYIGSMMHSHFDGKMWSSKQLNSSGSSAMKGAFILDRHNNVYGTWFETRSGIRETKVFSGYFDLTTGRNSIQSVDADPSFYDYDNPRIYMDSAGRTFSIWKTKYSARYSVSE